MPRFRTLIATTLLGLTLVAGGVACGGDDSDGEPTPVETLQPFDNRTLTPLATATLAVSTAVATATPPPFDGQLASMAIPSLGIDYPIEVLGLKAGIAHAELDTPKNVTGAIGWYSIPEYANLQKPGFGGASMYSAHVDYEGVPGPFDRLAEIAPGAQITVTMAGGPVYTYEVFSLQGYVIAPQYVTAARPMIDMGKLIDAPDKPANEEWITVITCSCAPGRVIIPAGQSFGDCVDRDVVLAKRVS